MEVEIERAVAILKAGGLVAFPTETVYGLGADASNEAALNKLYTAKGRPVAHPVIVHIGERAQLSRWSNGLTMAAQKLTQKFWPGPLTIIVRRAPGVSDLITGGQDTIGLRMPAHPMALTLLKRFGGGIAAPSANRFGHVSPTTAQHVRDEFGTDIDLVLDGGQSDFGIESTIVDVTTEQPVLLRPGHISKQEIAETVGAPVASAHEHSPRAPGSLAAHYAPRTPLIIVEGAQLEGRYRALVAAGKRAGVLARASQSQRVQVNWMIMPLDAVAYAHELYGQLRALDSEGYDVILLEKPPADAAWAAVNDRIGRAAAGSQR